MNFLLSMPNDGQSNAYIINALNNLGHNVMFLDHRANLEMSMKYTEEILKHEKIEAFLVLYLVPGRTYEKMFITHLKTQFPHVKYLSWIFDATMENKLCDQNDNFINIVKEYDYFFSVCRGQIESFREKGVNAFHIKEGFDVYTRDFNDVVEKEYDVSFIGQIGHPQIHKMRVPILKRVCNRFENTKIYGPVLSPIKELSKFHSKRSTFNDVDHSKVVAKTKVNLGISGWIEIDGYFSARNYRIMGSGGFLLANRTKNVEEFFEEDKEIVLFDNEKECVDKISYYLKNEKEREKIAKAGKDKVLSDYTFDHSMTDIVRIIND